MVLLNQDGVSDGERAGERSRAHLNLISLTLPDLRKLVNTAGTVPPWGQLRQATRFAPGRHLAQGDHVQLRLTWGRAAMQLTGHPHRVLRAITSARLRVPARPVAVADGGSLLPAPTSAEEPAKLRGMTEKSRNGLSSSSAGRVCGGTQLGKK